MNIIITELTPKTILYVGGFILPDRNAAAQRVVTIAKALRDIGYEVVFFNDSPYSDNIDWREIQYYGFKCFERRQENGRFKGFGIDHVKKFVSNTNTVKAVIAYNYPTIGLIRLKRFCKSHNISCIGDVTEWYRSRDKNRIVRLLKDAAIEYRMRVVQKRLNGIIVISDYLENYYRNSTKIVNIPPLVDKEDDKWKCLIEEHTDVRFIYAGSPNQMKERLDQIVDIIIELRKCHNVNLAIVGISLEEFLQIYDYEAEKIRASDCISFLGRIPHKEVIKLVSNADYSFIIRDRNRITTAGFPTKFVESISCGTAVITNDNSCISKYLSEGKNGILVSQETLKEDVEDLLNRKIKPTVERETFDYRKHNNRLKNFMGMLC